MSHAARAVEAPHAPCKYEFDKILDPIAEIFSHFFQMPYMYVHNIYVAGVLAHSICDAGWRHAKFRHIRFAM